VISTAVADATVRTGGERRIIVMIGAPGAGKGTQAERLVEALGLPHVSTGEIFREAVRQGSTLGEQVRGVLGKGLLVPDDVTVRMVDARLREDDATQGAILDGFPRTRAQADALDALLEEDAASVTAALYIEVGTDELVRRLSGRRICSSDDQHVYHIIGWPPASPGICDIDGAELVQRKDDEPATVRSRLDRQLPPMYEVIDHYADAGVLVAIRGEQPVETVTVEMLKAISKAVRGV
jgi:adenylate kinase